MTSRVPRVVLLATACALLFAAGVLVAGTLVDGYRLRADHVSALAGRGSPAAWLVVPALLLWALAHLAVAAQLMSVGLLGAGDALGLAGVAWVVAALARVDCRSGVPGCGRDPTAPSDWLDVTHGLAAGAAEILTLVAMVLVAVAAARRITSVWWGPASLALAGGSLLLLGRADDADGGLWQRLWLLDHLVWLVGTAWLLRPATDRRS